MLRQILFVLATCLLFRGTMGASVICEGQKTKLVCDCGQRIAVQYAIYGRRDTKTCSKGRPLHQISNVKCARSSTKVAQNCDGKTSCVVTASNSVFGVPCPGTYKYLEVAYCCQRSGKVITIHSATYGRSDTKTCSSGRPMSQISNVNCARSSAKQVAEICSGRPSCSFTANNAMFGDPCFGTYKYLTVDYSCD